MKVSCKKEKKKEENKNFRKQNEQSQIHKRLLTECRVRWQIIAHRVSGEITNYCPINMWTYVYRSMLKITLKPHPLLCHPRGSRGLRWLTFHASYNLQKNKPRHTKIKLFWDNFVQHGEWSHYNATNYSCLYCSSKKT